MKRSALAVAIAELGDGDRRALQTMYFDAQVENFEQRSEKFGGLDRVSALRQRRNCRGDAEAVQGAIKPIRRRSTRNRHRLCP